MRIALVHSFYRTSVPSGENTAVLEVRDALSAAGHEVAIVRRDSDDLGAGGPVRAALTVATGIGPSPVPELRAFGPDIVHVHNLYPNFGQRWVHDWHGPLVATIHNFRTLCARGTLHRDGQLCTLCPDGNRWSAVQHRCYRGSAVATIPWAVSPLHGRQDPLLARAHQIIALSERSKAILERYGLDGGRLVVVPNGVSRLAATSAPASPRRWLFLGRLDADKGLSELLSSWPAEEQLDVVGDGPLWSQVLRQDLPNVAVLGLRDRTWLEQHLPQYTGLIFASRLLENSPMSVLEALSCGVPVVARGGSAGADLIACIDKEWVYEGADARTAMQHVVDAGESARERALNGYLAAHTPAKWVAHLEAVYVKALAATHR